MAASTQDRYDIKTVSGQEVDFGVAAATDIFHGICVCVNAAGYLVPASDTAGLVFVGLSAKQTLNTAGANGAIACPVQMLRRYDYLELDAVSPVQTWVGELVYFSDDHTVALVGTTTNDIPAGRCVAVNDTSAAGRVLVDVNDRS